MPFDCEYCRIMLCDSRLVSSESYAMVDISVQVPEGCQYNLSVSVQSHLSEPPTNQVLIH